MLSRWTNMDFAHPMYLWLLPVTALLFVGWFYFNYRKQHASFTLSNTEAFKGLNSWKEKLLVILPLLRFLTLACIIIALARPQSTHTDEKINSFGIDMVLAMDVSSSMLARDFKPDRLEAAKDVASTFIENRPEDRIGLVIFGAESFTQVPITTDHKIVQTQLAKIKNGLLVDGTAIGMGLGTSINRLKDSPGDSKVIVLMTDGDNNAGLLDPQTATDLAIQYGIKVYTIGIGTTGEAYMPAYQLPDGTIQYEYRPVIINEELLTEIATKTGGLYYRAEDKEALTSIYAQIDQLEKTEIESSISIQTKELFYPFAALAILFLFFEQGLKLSLLRTFP